MEQHEGRLKELEQRYLNMIQQIDKDYLRKLQGDMHRCAANCCDNKSYSMERNQNCIQNCSLSVENAQRYVETEVARLQNRWSRCIMECNDATRDKAGASQQSSSRLTDEFNGCAAKCIDTQFNIVRTVETSIRRVLESGQYNKEV